MPTYTTTTSTRDRDYINAYLPCSNRIELSERFYIMLFVETFILYIALVKSDAAKSAVKFISLLQSTNI